jgi:hypothetical protein
VAPGSSSQRVGTAVNGDTTPEADKTFFLNLSLAPFSPADPVVTIVDGQGMATIRDDDPPTLPPSGYLCPTPYLSFDDSPLKGLSFSYFHLETFEDHLFNVPGVSADFGGVTSVVFGPSIHDSVDGDDGMVDGSGLGGDSFFAPNGPGGITFTFNSAVLGSLPTHAGIVWTDGGGGSLVTFEAFDRDGKSLGIVGPVAIADFSNNGETGEDRFVGVINEDGISAIKIRNTSGGIEVDHLQYGAALANQPPTGVSAGGPYSISEGDSLALSALATDPDSNQLTFSWDINGDNAFDDAIGQNPTLSWADLQILGINDGPALYDVKVSVSDPFNPAVISSPATLTVNNTPPTLVISGAAEVNEGAEYTLNLESSDPGQDTIDNWTIHWGDGATTIIGPDIPRNVTHVYADGFNQYQITATATDEDGTYSANEVAVAVLNVAPGFGGAPPLFEVVENSPNGTVVGTVAGTDPGDDTLTYSISGGSGATAFAINPNTGEITVADARQLDFETTPSFTLEVTVTDDEGDSGTAEATIRLLNQASISGTVFVDANQDGLFEADEMGIDGVTIQLLDATGNSVLDTTTTSLGGIYLFEDFDPGTYQVRELQPSGVDDGAEHLGSLGGSIVANDTMQLTLARTDALNYVFTELGQQVASGDAAASGFWANKHGQALITAGGAALAQWLTNNFSNVFGDALANADGAAVGAFFKDQLFKQKGVKSAKPPKVDAQFMAVAMAAYFTSSNLAGNVAACYGFNVTDTGIGTKIVNVGSNGAAFGVSDDTSLTIMQLLLATNSLTDLDDSSSGFAHIYDRNGDGVIDSGEAALRAMANDIYSAINEQGGI